MKLTALVQGSPDWHAHRAACLNASDAPAMMGVSTYKTRSELIRERATGITPDYDAATLARFASGHAAEAAARPMAEKIIGDELYPVVGEQEFSPELRLSASSDGMDIGGAIGFEHKVWNEVLAASVRNGVVPDSHHWQIVHQHAVFGLEKTLFMVSDGTPEKCAWCWVEVSQAQIDQLLSGWRQFAMDVSAYVPAPIVAEVIGHEPETLPALFVQVEGKVVASNMPAFRAAAAAFLDNLPKVMQTDQNFADGEKAVKACKEAEENLAAVKRAAQAQAVTIDEVFRTIDDISERIRAARLSMDKLVKAEKDNRRAEIVAKARDEFGRHWGDLCRRIGGEWIPALPYAYFADAIKGLKSLDSMRDKIGAAMANAKIETNSIADRIQANKEACASCMHLFPDFGSVCQKDPADFANLLSARKAEAERREDERMEADRARIRAEEQAKAERVAHAKARAEQDARDAETARQRALEQDRLRQERAAELARIEAEQKVAIREALEAQRAEQEKAAAIAPPIVKTKAPTPDHRAAVVEHQDEIAAFMASRDFRADAGRVRAILVEFVKFQASHTVRKKAETELEDMRASGHRLALELECLLMDTKDTAVQSRWWNPAMDALEVWQNLFPYTGPRLGD